MRGVHAGAAFAAAGWLLAGSASAQSAAPGVMLTAQAGIDGMVRAGRFTSVRIGLENPGPAISGTVVIEAGGMRTVRAVVLPAPSRKRLEVAVRLPAADLDRIRVEFSSLGRTVRSVEVPVHPVSDESRLVLCVAPGSAAERCTARIEALQLPSSWRGYDSVDELILGEGIEGALSEEQRVAIGRWKTLHVLGQVVGPATPRLVSSTVIGQTRYFVACYATLFLGLVMSARALARRPARLYAGLTATVMFGGAAAAGQGRIGPGSAVQIDDVTIVRALEGHAEAFLTTRGSAGFPAFSSFELTPASDDGVITARREPGDVTYSEHGGALLAGVFGKGQTVAFDVEGFASARTLDVGRSPDHTNLRNAGDRDLSECEFPAGFSPRTLPVLKAGATVVLTGQPDEPGEPVTCRIQAARATVVSRNTRVRHNGSGFLLYVLAPGARDE